MREGHPKRPFADALAPAPAGVAASDAELTALPPRHREALAKLEQGYEMACSTEGFRQYLRVVSHLYAYSPRNVVLIFAQMPEATMVTSYDRWRAAGRQVRKGEQGLRIFYPQFRLCDVENDATGEIEKHKLLTGFGIGSVFDVSQTDGPPIAPPPLPEDHFATTEEARLVDRTIASFLIGEGLRLEQKGMNGKRGYFDPDEREIALNAELPDDDGKAKTLVHEAAHYLAGDKGGWKGRDLREFVAEGSAYAALLSRGVDTGTYSIPYLQWFTREPDMMATAMPRIAIVTRKLIAVMDGEKPEEMGEWL
jgi:hypothetical protein